MLRLVDDERRELLVVIGGLEVALQQGVGGDDDVGVGNLIKALRPLGTGDDEHLQPRRELQRFRLPVANERGRTDD